MQRLRGGSFVRLAVLSVLALASAALLLLIEPASSALALTLTVSQTGDAADPTPGDGICDVDAVTAGQPVLAAGGRPDGQRAGRRCHDRHSDGRHLHPDRPRHRRGQRGDGDLDIVNGSTLTIRNTSGGTVAIDGDHADRVFDVKASAGLTLIGLTVQNGTVSGSSGGNIASVGTLTLLNVAVNNGTSNQFGGGVDLENGIATFTGVTMTNDTSSGSGGFGGGALFVNTAASLTGSNVALTGNHATGKGGAIFTVGPITLTDSTIAGNDATLAGGINQEGGTLTLTAAPSVATRPTTALTPPAVAWQSNGRVCPFRLPP